MLNGMPKEALREYRRVLEEKEGVFKDAILSLTLTEKFQFYRTIGDLYEKNELIDEALPYYESAYHLFEKHPDIDIEISAYLDVLNALVYLFKSQAMLDKALF